MAFTVAGNAPDQILGWLSAVDCACIRSFAWTWTTDLKSQSIRVNVVSPGMVLTPEMATYLQSNDGAEEWMKQAIPFGRLAETEKVAKAVLFLASSECSFLGAEELMVDGGFVAVLVVG